MTCTPDREQVFIPLTVGGAGQAVRLGAGEILLNSMDADGTRAGFDLELIAALRAAVDVPIVARGGAGAVEHFAPRWPRGRTRCWRPACSTAGSCRWARSRTACGAGVTVR